MTSRDLELINIKRGKKIKPRKNINAIKAKRCNVKKN
jgi:hypothetical protein